MESDRGYVCDRHGRFVKPGEECPHCEPIMIKAAAPRSFDAAIGQHRVAAYTSYGLETVYDCLCGFSGDFRAINEHVVGWRHE